jgi:hypothetical protein
VTKAEKFSIHGHAVEVHCHVPSLCEPIAQTIKHFAPAAATKFAPIRGTIKSFKQDEVTKHLSPLAKRMESDELCEIYQHEECFWLIDDHWGICEINMLKGQWRSWILDEASADMNDIFEQAALWPIVQLLRPRGLSIIPAAAVVRDGWGVLVLCSFNIEPELTELVHAGFKVVGQRFVAIREEGAQIQMLHMPGHLERIVRAPNGAAMTRVDLTAEFCGCESQRAKCDAIMLIAPGRRPLSNLRRIAPSNAVHAIQSAWPMHELHAHHRQSQLPLRMAKRCQTFGVQLSRNPKDLLGLMHVARYEQQPRANVA